MNGYTLRRQGYFLQVNVTDCYVISALDMPYVRMRGNGKYMQTTVTVAILNVRKIDEMGNESERNPNIGVHQMTCRVVKEPIHVLKFRDHIIKAEI